MEDIPQRRIACQRPATCESGAESRISMAFRRCYKREQKLDSEKAAQVQRGAEIRMAPPRGLEPRTFRLEASAVISSEVCRHKPKPLSDGRSPSNPAPGSSENRSRQPRKPYEVRGNSYRRGTSEIHALTQIGKFRTGFGRTCPSSPTAATKDQMENRYEEPHPSRRRKSDSAFGSEPTKFGAGPKVV